MRQDALGWVPTKGNDVPPLAVPLHTGPNGQQLYVARAFLDGEPYIGTTSFSSSKGACIRDRYGRSRDVFEYEVLTCASNVRFVLERPSSVEPAKTTPRRGHRAENSSPRPESTPPRTPGRLTPLSWLSPPRDQPEFTSNEPRRRGHQNDPPPYVGPKRLPPISLSRKEAVQFKHLTRSKCFTVIDDTPSMQYKWEQTREALRGIVDILSSESQWDGLNVRFLYHTESRPCVRTVTEFEQVFNSVTLWRGDKVVTTKVSQVFAESFSIIHETPNPKPVVLLIITDALAVDTQDLYDVIIRFSDKLNEKRVPDHMFRIHLLQMGDERSVINPLHDFRNQISQQDRGRHLFNVVSYHRGRGLLNAQNITKLLLASTYIPVEEDPNIGERLPSEVVSAQYQEVDNIRRMGRW